MYCIYNQKKDMFCRWDGSIILFDTKEQCNEFIKAIPDFFNDAMDYVRILPITEEMKRNINNNAVYVIHYDKLDKSLFPEENNIVKYNKNMKEVLKNG